MNNNKKIIAYKNALRVAWGYNDYNDWPIKFNSIMHLFLKEFTLEFLEDLEKIKKERILLKMLSNSFSNPARIFRIINPVIYGMKLLKLDIVYQRSIVIFLLKLIKELKYGSEFNENGKNIILDREKLDEIAELYKFNKANKNSSEILQKTCGLMWAYTEAIFFRAHDVTKEIHGPYFKKHSFNNLIIREYLNLNPREIWIKAPLLDINKIKIYTEYSQELKVQIDPYNHLFHHAGNFRENLLYYYIEIDGKEKTVEYLKELYPKILLTINYIHNWSNKSNWKVLTNRYADIYWYRKRPLRNLMNIDWKVPAKVRDFINNGNIDKRRIKNLTKKEIDFLISSII